MINTEIIKINKENKEKVLEKGAHIIQNGGLVVFPTETVYGLGANALDENAVSKIFLAKGRPGDNPLIVHINKISDLQKIVSSVSDTQKKIMDAFWPGPLTIIFDKKENVPQNVSGGLSTVAVRMPAHDFARELIEKAGVPIAAPSANISGKPSSTLGEYAKKDLFGKVDLIIDEGSSDIGVESTVVKIEKEGLYILRPGAITKEMIEREIYLPVYMAEKKEDLKASPGTLYKHYAPKANLELVKISNGKTQEQTETTIREKILTRAKDCEAENKTVGIIGTEENAEFYKKYYPNVFILGSQNNLLQVSKNLYKGLRFFDDHNVDIILCESFSEEGIGQAIMDRLKKASQF